MPLQALLDKKYRCGTLPASKMSDKEHTSPALRHGSWVSLCSDILSVQHSPADAIPEFNQRLDEGAKIPSTTAAENTWDVFPDDIARLVPTGDC